METLSCSFRIIENRPKESFLQFQNGIRMQAEDFPESGIRAAVRHILTHFEDAHNGEMWVTPKKNPSHIGDIDVLIHQRTGSGWASHTTKAFNERTLMALHLLYWSKHRSEKGRFADVVHSIRTCTVCGREQRGILTGFTRHHPVQPNFAWPADVCVDPDCLSHKLDEAVDPAGYRDRREELRKVMETENGQDDIPEDIRRAVGQAKAAKLLD